MPIIPIALEILGNRFAQIGLAFVIGFSWAWIDTNHKWEIKIAEQQAVARAAYEAELERERQAAISIAKDATIRAEQDALAMKDLQKQIDDFDRTERIIVKTEKGKCPPCTIDDSFANVVRGIDKSSSRR